jgi:hypothetical protein
MNAITGTWKNGQIVLDEPAHWPEGSRVVIEPTPRTEDVGMTEEGQGDDPESIARWLAEFDAIPPWEITMEEETRWQADRQAVKDYTIAKMKQRFGGNEP